MKAYMLSVGLEHLQSGIEFECTGNLSFARETPTIFIAWSLQPFTAVWYRADCDAIRIQAQFADLPTATQLPWTDAMIREQVTKNQKAADILR